LSSVEDHFSEAARAYAGLVAAIAPEQWTAPGLGEWDLRALVGHTSRSLITVETYLGQPAVTEQLTSPAAYLAAIGTVDPASVADRGRAAGEALGDDPTGFVRVLVDRVLPLVTGDHDPLITTVGGGMRLRQYLPTRTFELVVHGMDIAAAAGVPDDLPAAAVAEATVLAARVAAALGDGPPVLRALTGRGGLPAGFSVV
jgi:uncharacterized protein (TIGR03083 family)